MPSSNGQGPIKISSLTPKMIDAVDIDGEVYKAYLWGDRTPIRIQAAAQEALFNPEYYNKEIEIEGKTRTDYKDMFARQQCLADVLCVVVEGLTPSQAELLTPTEVYAILVKIGFFTDTREEDPKEMSLPLIGEKDSPELVDSTVSQ